MTPAQIKALERFEALMIRARLLKNTRAQYLHWARRFAASNPPGETREERVSAFLSTLSTHCEATQKQALNALAGKNGLFALLGKPIGKLPEWVRPRRSQRAPAWVTVSEASEIMRHLSDPWETMVGLMIGSGLRIHECMSLRWRDIDLERLTITVRGGKGDKDRVTVLASQLAPQLLRRRDRCRALYLEDRGANRPGVAIPDAVCRKYPNAGADWPFFWVFPSASESRDPETGIVRRHHVHDKSLSRPLRVAVRRAGIAKRVTAHAFRHGFATAYLLNGGHLRELQRLMGHSSIETTEIYIHCLPSHTDRIGSPLDVVQMPASPHILRFPKSA